MGICLNYGGAESHHGGAGRISQFGIGGVMKEV